MLLAADLRIVAKEVRLLAGYLRRGMHPGGGHFVILSRLIGREAAGKWPEWKDRLHYVDYAILALIVVGLVYLFVRWRRRRAPAPA